MNQLTADGTLSHWRPGDISADVPERFRIGVCWWNGYDKRLLRTIREELTNHPEKQTHFAFEVFDADFLLALACDPSELEPYFPGFDRNVLLQEPIIGYWRHGDLVGYTSGPLGAALVTKIVQQRLIDAPLTALPVSQKTELEEGESPREEWRRVSTEARAIAEVYQEAGFATEGDTISRNSAKFIASLQHSHLLLESLRPYEKIVSAFRVTAHHGTLLLQTRSGEKRFAIIESSEDGTIELGVGSSPHKYSPYTGAKEPKINYSCTDAEAVANALSALVSPQPEGEGVVP